jgi:ribosomal protein S27E
MDSEDSTIIICLKCGHIIVKPKNKMKSKTRCRICGSTKTMLVSRVRKTDRNPIPI